MCADHVFVPASNPQRIPSTDIVFRLQGNLQMGLTEFIGQILPSYRPLSPISGIPQKLGISQPTLIKLRGYTSLWAGFGAMRSLLHFDARESPSYIRTTHLELAH